MRSTTELRQHFFGGARAYDGAALRRVNPLEGGRFTRHLDGMSSNDKKREERLAAALRENLRRRKAHSRKMDEAAKDEEAED